MSTKNVNISKNFSLSDFSKIYNGPTGRLADHTNIVNCAITINVLVTNACNLSCSYCFEQHEQDSGKWDVAALKKVWDYLLHVNQNANSYMFSQKVLRFFGGEPLLNKKLILDFMRTYRSEIEHNAGFQTVGMVTNGLLLDEEFMDEFFSYPDVLMDISLDTINPSLDTRGLDEAQIQTVLNNFELAVKKAKDPLHQIALSATISPEQAPFVKDLFNELYKRGVRRFTFNPLLSYSKDGHVVWPEDIWENFISDLVEIIENSPEPISVSPEDGIMDHESFAQANCCLEVDPSGDFSGCVFAVNKKHDMKDLILGNILNDEMYLDNVDYLQDSLKLLTTHDKCMSCEVSKWCYQFPTGNLITGGQVFEPTPMCQKIADYKMRVSNASHSRVLILQLMTARRMYEDAFRVNPSSAMHQLISIVIKAMFGKHVFKDEVAQLTKYGHDRILAVMLKLYQEKKKIVVADIIDQLAITNQWITTEDFYKEVSAVGSSQVLPREHVAKITKDIDVAYLLLTIVTAIKQKWDA